MARQPKPVNSLEMTARHIDERLDRLAPALAERLGPPPNTDRYTQRERDALWDTPDAQVNRDALFKVLQAGLPEQDVERFALFRMAPELAKLVTATPLQPEMAATVATLAEHPGRYVLTVGHSADPREQVKFVEEQQRRAAKRQGAGESPPEPMAPEPAMEGY